jgi:hypothetical protein
MIDMEEGFCTVGDANIIEGPASIELYAELINDI